MPVDLFEEYDNIIKDTGNSSGGAVDLFAEYENIVSPQKSEKTSGIRAFLDPLLRNLSTSNLTGGPLAKAIRRPYEEKNKERFVQQAEEHPYANFLGGLSGNIGGELPLMAIPGYGAGKIARYASQGALQGAAGGGINNLPQNLNLDEIKKTLLHGTAGGVLGGATAGGIGLLGKVFPTNLFQSKLSPEQLRENLEITRGTGTQLGEVIGNPALKRTFENVLPHIPGAGAYGKMIENAQNITNRGENITNALNPGRIPENIEEHLIDSISNTYKSNEAIKRQLYDTANQTAEQSGVDFQLSNFRDTITSLEDSLGKKTILKGDEGLINKLSQMRDELGAKTAIDPSTGLPRRSPITLSEANITKSNLKELSNEAYAKGEKYIGGIYNRLARSLEKDIKEGIDSSGNDALKSQFKEAQNYYKENIVPFEDRDVFKYISGKGDIDNFISNFIKTGNKQDRHRKLSKLTNILPEEQKSLLAHGYFSRAIDAEGKMNATALRSLFNSLGKKQREVLLGDKAKNFSDFSKLVQKNEKSFQTMFNPPTGQVFKDFGTIAAIAGSGASLGGPLGAAIAAGGVPLASKYAVKKLTSEKTREKFIKKLIKKQLSSGSKRNIPPYLAGVLSESIMRGQE